MKIEEVNQTTTINVFGVPFHGIDEIKKYAISHEPKEGVYVGEDWQSYPCFDFDDFANENRFYSNFVFAQSRDELTRKLDIVKKMNWSCNYCKLKADTSDELLPMIYFGGDTYHPLVIGVCQEIVF